MQDAEKTPGRQGGSQLHACAPGLEVSLCQLSQRRLLKLGLAQQLFQTRVLLAQLTQFLGLTPIHRPITLAPPTQRRLADTQHAADLGRTHALTSQRLGLLQLHDNLLRRVLRELPRGHPFCPAASSQDYSEQPSHNKRSKNPDPSRPRVGGEQWFCWFQRRYVSACCARKSWPVRPRLTCFMRSPFLGTAIALITCLRQVGLFLCLEGY